MIDVSATGRKSLNYLAPGFLAMGIIVDCFHERGIECVFKSNWKNLVKIDRANFHNTAPQAIGSVCFVWVNT